jgi:hypothetical protein
VNFGFAQFVSSRSSSFFDVLSLFSTVFDLLQASFGLPYNHVVRFHEGSMAMPLNLDSERLRPQPLIHSSPPCSQPEPAVINVLSLSQRRLLMLIGHCLLSTTCEGPPNSADAQLQ